MLRFIFLCVIIADLVLYDLAFDQSAEQAASVTDSHDCATVVRTDLDVELDSDLLSNFVSNSEQRVRES
jgi:hypothetical protein